MTSIVTLVNRGLASEGLPQVTQLYGAIVDPPDAVVILQQKCNEANRELCREFEWPQLIKQGTILLNTGTPSYPFPADFDSWVFDTVYNANDNWALGPPLSPQEYMERQYSFVSPINRQRFIALGYTSGNVTISPTPTAADSGHFVTFLYMSTNRVEVSAGSATYLSDFNADTNVPVLDEDALRYRIMSHYFRSKGLEYAHLAAQALERSNERIAAIRGAGPIYCGGRLGRLRFLSNSNVPQTGFGS